MRMFAYYSSQMLTRSALLYKAVFGSEMLEPSESTAKDFYLNNMRELRCISLHRADHLFDFQNKNILYKHKLVNIAPKGKAV